MQYSFLAQLIRFQLYLVGGIIVFNRDSKIIKMTLTTNDYNINNNNDVIIIIISLLLLLLLSLLLLLYAVQW